MGAIARRIKRLENLRFQNQAESGPDLVAIFLARRRKRAIAEGREPGPDPPPGPFLDSSGHPLTLAAVLLQRRKRPEAS
jgi:hypothetical protein